MGYLISFFLAAGSLVGPKRLIAASVAASFALFGYIYYYPYFVPALTERLFFDTEGFAYHQYYYFIWDKLQRWELPLWNPYMLSGIPIFANTGLGFLNPLAILGAFFYDPSGAFLANARAFVYLTLMTVFVGNVGMYLLLRHFGLSRLVAVIASIWFSYSGVNLVKNIYVEEATINYLYPWLFLFFLRYLKGGKARYLFLIAAALAVVISTTHVILVAVTFLNLTLLSALSLAFDHKRALTISNRDGVRSIELSRRFLLFIPLAVVSVLASLSILLPYIEYLRHASLGVTPATLGQIEQVEPGRGLLPAFTMFFADNYPVFGLITAAGIFLYRRKEKKYIIAMLVFYFLLGIKQYGGIERLLYIFTPFGAYLLPRHYHYHVWYYVPFYTTVLFACGLEVFFEKPVKGGKTAAVLLASGVLILLATAYRLKAHVFMQSFISTIDPVSYFKGPSFIIEYFKTHPLEESRLIVCFLLLVFFLSLLLKLYGRAQGWAKAVCAFILLAVILNPLHRWYFDSIMRTVKYGDVATSSSGLNTGINYESAAPMPWRQGIYAQRRMTLDTHYDVKTGRFGKDTIIFRREYDINGIARIWPKRYKEFLQTVNLPVMGFQDDLWRVEKKDGPVDWRLARLLAVNPEDVRQGPENGGVAGLDPLPAPRAFARFEIIPDYIVVKGEDGILPKMKEVDLKRFVVLEDEPSFPSAGAAATDGYYKGAAGEDSVNVTEFSEKRIKLTIRSARRRAFLLHSQNFYPGWKAAVDGEDIPLYRANYTFQAIPIGRGEHTVVLYFDPLVFKISKWIAIISILSFSALFVWYRNRVFPEGLSFKIK